jgi:hypothetical protein
MIQEKAIKIEINVFESERDISSLGELGSFPNNNIRMGI